MTVADFIAEQLLRRGVQHVFGVGGANIEDLFAAVQRRRPRIRMVLGKHEHAAGTAADAYGRLGGGLGVVFTTSGGGAMNLVHALAEARASRVPLLAVVGEPPTDVQGRGAFQDTSGRDGAVDVAQVFQAVSVSCARVERAGDLPRLLDAAMAAACGERPGPAVLLIAKDRQRAELTPEEAGSGPLPNAPIAARADRAGIRAAARALEAQSVVIVAGDEVARAGARDELAEIARALDAWVAVAPDGRDAFDNHGARFLGVAGAMGHPAVGRAIEKAGACLLVGTRLPLLARQGIEPILRDKPLVSVGREPPFICTSQSVHLGGDLAGNLRALRDEISTRQAASASSSGRASLDLRNSVDESWGSPAILGAVERSLPAGSVVVVDAGNTGAQAVHHLRVPRGGRWLLAMGMAGMGYAFGAAIGAALATGQRCTVLAGDGAFFMHGLDVHTAIEHALPITYVIFNNQAHGMCLVRERLLLGEEGGYNTFRPSHIGAGLAAMFPGLSARDCVTLGELEQALELAARSERPSVIGVELPTVEVPPFAAFAKAAAAAPGVKS
ncbi:MAG TPA: thiamine pyrophosphate-binding protein [Polyangia bacterium]|jgi:acetolactate synthase-1/2/3 large subunit|nr:thiamine pyrophosphate-binding protein [Polyangia bacterium]